MGELDLAAQSSSRTPAKPRSPKSRADWDDAAFIDGAEAAAYMGPRGFAKVLLATIVVFFAVMVTWAAIAKLDEVTRGEGRVIPSRQVQKVQNLEGGIVAEMLTHEGAVVEEGEILMRIDNQRAASDFREKNARYLSLLGAIARLQAEIDETAPVFPAEVLSQAREIAENEMALFQSRQEELEGELEILRQQAEQRQQEVAELEQQITQFQRSYNLAAEELRVTEPMVQQRIVPRVQYLQLQREVNDLRGQLEQARLALPRAQSALREAHKRVEGAFSTFRSEALRELTLKKAELSEIRELIALGEDQVARTEVRSPVRGTINKLHVNTIGGVIQPGQDLIDIVPLEDNLLIEAKVRPTDIAFLRPGLPATVKITAYDFSIYGGLDGVVENISADTIVDEEGESFYRVRVRTDDTHLGDESNPLVIIPGMTAQVDVLTGEKSVLDYILKPILKARDNALRER